MTKENLQKASAPIQLVSLTEDKLDALMKAAGEAGAYAALRRYESERKKSHKKIIDKRLRNTRLLLKNYHLLKMSVANSIYQKTQMQQESAADILDSMMNLYDDEVIIDSIKRSVTRTAIIISHVEAMLDLYKIYCCQSGKEIERRRYEILFDFYISEKLLSVKEISSLQNQSRQTVYDDLKIGEDRLSALIFGIDGIKL